MCLYYKHTYSYGNKILASFSYIQCYYNSTQISCVCNMYNITENKASLWQFMQWVKCIEERKKGRDVWGVRFNIPVRWRSTCLIDVSIRWWKLCRCEQICVIYQTSKGPFKLSVKTSTLHQCWRLRSPWGCNPIMERNACDIKALFTRNVGLCVCVKMQEWLLWQRVNFQERDSKDQWEM